MKTALSLGRRGLGRVWPNPAVGCVLVKDGLIVGRGWTQPGGRPHAETEALAQAGTRAKGATAYVTLEPCAHHGKTPPCAQALIDAGVSCVVAAIEDSDRRVSGKGFAMLRDAGIKVITGVCAREAALDNAGFFKRVEAGRPFLTLKLALTLDGRIATRTGDSQWITDSVSRRRVHALRASHDAVLIGGGTARADDPSLTVRGLGTTHQPVRVVATRDLNVPLEQGLARTAKEIPLWLCHGPDADVLRLEAWERTGAQLVACSVGARGLEPLALMQSLGARGLTRVFCEGGGVFAASLLRAGFVDRLIVHSAGVLIGDDGLAGVAGLNCEVLADAQRWERVSVRGLGADVETVWSPTRSDDIH